MLGQGWQYQWARVGRRLDDVRGVYEGSPGGTDVAIDRVLSFFEAVHHLKDWLGNDPAVEVQKCDGDELIEASRALRICADLANGSKHLKLNTARTKDLSTALTSNDVIVLLGTGTSAHRFRVESGGATHDVLEIAQDAVNEWKTFLSDRNLL